MAQDRASRLRRSRQDRGFRSAAEAAKAFGWSRNTYAANENGRAPFSFRRAREYARAFGVDAEWLYAGEAELEGRRAPVIGVVGRKVDGSVSSIGLGDPVSAPALAPGWPPCDALVVSGGYLDDWAEPGAFLYVERTHRRAAPELVGQLVLAVLFDGCRVVAKVSRLAGRDRLDLRAVSGALLSRAPVRWASQVVLILPGRPA